MLKKRIVEGDDEKEISVFNILKINNYKNEEKMKKLKIIAIILCFSVLFQTVSVAADTIDSSNGLIPLEKLSGISKTLGHYFSGMLNLDGVIDIVEDGTDENTILLKNEDGSNTAYTFSEPVKFKDKDGKNIYKDTIINNTNIFNNLAFTYSNNSNNYQIGFSTEYRSGVKVQYDGISYTIGAVTSDFNLWSKLGYQERSKDNGMTIDMLNWAV